MIDVDNFKLYNDTYGHLAGDEVLKGVAMVMRQRFMRPTDLPARFGGEEFAVILPATPIAPLQTLGESLRVGVEELCILHSASEIGDRITISVGGASVIPKTGESFLQLIDRADEALYEAKRLGKNRVVIRN
jgi:two-component system chemotaxis family response regulator WspR